MVYTGLFPIDNKDYENLRDALDKLHVNDPSLVWEPETSVALGFGFRVGFLGLLHMEVVKERLEREFNLDLIATSPSVDYHVYKTDGEMIDVRSPQDLPEATRIERIEEPYLGQDYLPARVYGRRHAARYRASRRYDRHDPPDEQIGRDAL